MKKKGQENKAATPRPELSQKPIEPLTHSSLTPNLFRQIFIHQSTKSIEATHRSLKLHPKPRRSPVDFDRNLTTMSLEETLPRSPLDKPLHQLTEDDISQLTREDCRRYLKDKGMRRPSWNKSQAIQQVISLKKLLETTSDSDAGALKKLYIPRPPQNPHRVPKSSSVDTPICVESVPHRRKDPEESDISGDLSGRAVVAGNDSIPPRIASETNGPVGQMTIFYCGKVNVYDDVPAEKARTLMQLAASPVQFPLETPCDETTTRQSVPCHLLAAKVGPDSPGVILPNLQTVNIADNWRLHREESSIFREDNPVEGSGSRKASVQRYREKRKDRFKSKKKVANPSSASLDIYLNHQMGNQTQNERSNRSDACSPPQIRPPNTPTRCSSVDNIVKKANLSVALNDKDMQE